ncbi:hypothetical protein NLG97_g2023 [Lecanicillium saksenae]|uniref:Uncharacterized protein n=1 Tax=Lecanicillium saksenae TaxID=468837 RepID=A0ACC1R2Q3_9HYPO|nr:hypothetical protein NLG97_g2023 [Lecanicillium saksenae]
MPYIDENVTKGNGAPALSNKEWMSQQRDKIEDAQKANNFQRALVLIEQGLTKVRMWHDVRLWECALQRRKSDVLTRLGRLEEAKLAEQRAKWLTDNVVDLIDDDSD